MRRISLLLLLMLGAGFASAQETEEPSDTTYWTRRARGNFTFTQVNLSNWVGGGSNSVALNSNVGFFANYAKGRTTWQNALEMAYGLVDQENSGLIKSDDKISFITKVGHRLSKDDGKLFWTALLDFRTQFANGFASPEDPTRISTFMAPGYMVLSSGFEYVPNEQVSLTYGPLTGKMTFVLDDSLAAVGSYGVEAGEKVRAEFGSFLRLAYKNEIVENVTYESKLELFTNYLNNFGNIDVNWENIFLMQVNKWLAVNFIAHVIYDDDIDIEVIGDDGLPTGEVGPRLQFKQLFGVGVTYKVSNR